MSVTKETTWTRAWHGPRKVVAFSFVEGYFSRDEGTRDFGDPMDGENANGAIKIVPLKPQRVRPYMHLNALCMCVCVEQNKRQRF